MKHRLVLLVLVLLAPLLAVPTPAGAAPAARIVMEGLPARVVPGARLYLDGRVTGRVPRPVVVEQRRGGRWVQVARERTAAGGFYVGVRAPRRAGPATWRVVAPQVRRQGRLLPRVVGPSRSTRVIVQRVVFRLPRTARVGTTVRAFVRFVPYLRQQGTTVTLLVNGHRQPVGSATMRPRGATVRFRQGATGPVTYQVRRPAGGFVSRTLRGLPDPTRRATRRLSLTTNGSQLDDSAYDASSSDDGRWVAFVSSAENAVPGDTNRRDDVFLKDTVTGALRRVTHGTDGGPSNGPASAPAISGDGRFVAFVSRARNLVRGDTNGRPDVFVWSRATGAITRVGLDASEPVLSADGRHVAFTSVAGGAPAVLVRDRTTGQVTSLSAPGESAGSPAVSDDGGVVAWTGPDGVRLWERGTGETALVAPGGRRPHLDADASVVAYEAPAGADRGVYALDRTAGTTSLLATDAVPGEESDVPPTLRVDSVSADGSQVLLTSSAVLTDDDEDNYYCESEAECFYDDYTIDAYVADVPAGTVSLVSRSATGEVTDFFAEGFDLLADGSGVVFGSRDVLVPGQTGRDQYSSAYSYLEVFVRDL